MIGVALAAALHYLFVVVATAFAGGFALYAAARPAWFQRVSEVADPLGVALSGGSGVILAALAVVGILARFGLISLFPDIPLPESPTDAGESDS